MAYVKLIGAAAAVSVLAAAVVFRPDAAAQSKAAPVIPTAAPIDGSADPVSQDVALTVPDFSKIDELNPNLRSTNIDATKSLELKEDNSIVDIEKHGKPFKLVNFGTLSGFEYTAPLNDEMSRTDTTLPEKYQNQIPERVTQLNKDQVAVTGFMIPLEIERGRVKSFVLVRSQLYCCFGMVPQLNEWVHVRMNGNQRAPMLTEVPVTVYGDFEVGEVIENGQLMSIYRMNAAIIES